MRRYRRFDPQQMARYSLNYLTQMVDKAENNLRTG